MEHGQTLRWLNTSKIQLPVVGSKEPDELVYDLPFDKYLGNRTCISNSGLKKILKSPRHYIADLLGYEEEEEDGAEKDHFRFGRAAHMLILEPKKFRELHLVMPEFTGLTKDGKESHRSKDALDKKAKWLADVPPEALVLTQAEMDSLMLMVENLMAHETAANLLKNGRPEVTGFFTHKETGLRVRIRPDYLTWDSQQKLYISDLKTARDVSAGMFSTQTANLKYHMQLALYVDGVAQITGQQVEAQGIIALEKKMPHSCALYWINEDDLAKGRQWYEFALRTLKRCIDTNQWPGVQGDGVMLNLPKFTDNEQFPQFDWV